MVELVLPSATHVNGWYANEAKTIGVMKINRPRTKNCISMQTYQEITDHLYFFGEDPQVLAVILTGEGDEYFTSGTDVKEFDPQCVPSLSPTREMMTAIVQFKKILVAAVNGIALGIGVTILAHCDLVFSVPHATFRTPFMGLGIVPEFASSVTFPALLGKQATNDLLLRSKTLDAKRAHQVGLISEIVDGNNFLTRVLALTEEMTSQLHADVSLLLFKEHLNRVAPLSKQHILAAIDLEYEVIDKRYRTGEILQYAAAYTLQLSNKATKSKL